MNDFNTSAQGRELGWEDEIQQESSYILLPEGDYRFTVEKFDGSSVLLQENLFLHTMMEWKLSEFFASIGMKQKGQAARMNWQEVNGKSGICHVIIREYDKRDGSGKGKRNQIEKLYPSYDQPQLAQNPAQQPYSAPQPSYPQNSPQPWQPQQSAPQSSWNNGQF